MTELPLDAQERHLIETALGRSLIVEAAAGTGKTTVTVARIVHAIRAGGLRIERLAAITFTDKAASELRARVRKGLESARASIPVGASPERARLTRALADLSRARIGTIHAFAASLLRDRPLEAGVDPAFQQADALTAGCLFDRVLQESLEQGLASRDPRLMSALGTGISLSTLTGLASELRERAPAMPPEGPVPLDEGEASRFLERWRETQSELDKLAAHCSDPGDRGLQQIRTLSRRLDEAGALDGIALEALILETDLARNAGRKPAWSPPDACADQKRLIEGLARELGETRTAIGRRIAHRVLSWLREVMRQYDLEKRRRGILDFDDLLARARDMLRDSREARGWLQGRFSLIVVDEFQDTDPLQVEIVFLLAEAGARASGWREARPEPGKLLLVGDPKQSIYRFRNADIETYEAAKAQLEPHGSAVSIRQNFRTVPAILDWVNRVFARSMRKPEDASYQPEYVPMLPTGSRSREGGGVHLVYPMDRVTAESVVPAKAGIQERRDRASFLDPRLRGGDGNGAIHPVSRDLVRGPDPMEDDVPQGRGGVEAQRELEAACLAGLLDRIVGGAGREETGIPPLEWGEIAVLYRTGSGLSSLEAALERRRIPYVCEGGRSFYARDEVWQVVSALEAIQDPTDPAALLAALRGPLLAVGDDELLLHAGASGILDYREPVPDGAPRAIRDAFTLLDVLHRECGAISTARLIERFLDRTGAMAPDDRRPASARRAGNLLKLLDVVRAYELAESCTTRQVARWLRERVASEAREPDAGVRSTDPRAVRIMSIHKSKGLEFPAVCLFDLASPSRSTEKVLCDVGGGLLEIALRGAGSPFKTGGFDSLRERSRVRDEAEQVRLLYVAATRARDYLIVPIVPARGGAGLMALLEDFVPRSASPEAMRAEAERLGVRLHLIPAGDQGEERPAPRTVVPSGALPLDRAAIPSPEAWTARRRDEAALGASGPAILTASRLAHAGEPEESGEGRERGAPLSGQQARRPPWRAEALALGDALHRCLQQVDLASGEDAGELAIYHAAACGVAHRSAEVAAMVRTALGSSVVRRAAASPHCRREVPFCVSCPEGLSEGSIDLVFVEEGGLVLVDFKTDSARGAELDERMRRHARQGALYALMAEEATGARVRDVVFLFVRTGEERSIGGGASLRRIAEELLGREG